MKWSFYDANTGQVARGKLTCSERLAKLNARGRQTIAGHYDHLSQRVDVAAMVDATRGDHSTVDEMPAERFVVDYQPPKPDDDHEWKENVVNGRPRWVKKADVAAREARDRAARSELWAIDLASVRLLRERSSDPALVALEAKAVELRKDVVQTPAEMEKAKR